jgi:hypothetical protein
LIAAISQVHGSFFSPLSSSTPRTGPGLVAKLHFFC